METAVLRNRRFRTRGNEGNEGNGIRFFNRHSQAARLSRLARKMIPDVRWRACLTDEYGEAGKRGHSETG